MEDVNYGMRDMFRNFIVNGGMMGVLKTKRHLWDKGRQELGRWAENEGLRDYKGNLDIVKAGKKMIESVAELPTETKAQKKIKKQMEQDLDDFVRRQLKNAEVDIDFFENREARLDEATKLIELV